MRDQEHPSLPPRLHPPAHQPPSPTISDATNPNRPHPVRRSTPAKAALLVAMSLRPPFVLPAERGPEWYGMSADTFARGFLELRRNDLLSRQFTTVVDWSSPTGKRTEYKFSLKPPFTRSRRLGRSHLKVVGA